MYNFKTKILIFQQKLTNFGKNNDFFRSLTLQDFKILEKINKNS